ncbi:MAG: hypothetical protein LCH56_10225 [Proteobacteria bacterium]|nr:hypothetical protein [Pseudomonadota bacterium]
MATFTEFLKSRASGRAVAAAAIFALLVAAVQHWVLIPHFQAVTTFKPFDVQFPLTRYMVAIQLGAYERTAGPAYLPFFMVDLLLAFVSAGTLMLLWSWLFRRPNRISAFLERGGIIFVPLYTLVCDVAENIAFGRLIGGLSGDSFANTVEFAVTVHSVRGALLDLQVILTLLFVILFGLGTGTQEQAGSLERETAVNGE